MSKKYHLSPKSGEPKECHAEQRSCPHGGESEHWASQEEARKAFETNMEAKQRSSHEAKVANSEYAGLFFKGAPLEDRLSAARNLEEKTRKEFLLLEDYDLGKEGVLERYWGTKLTLLELELTQLRKDDAEEKEISSREEAIRQLRIFLGG